jgi:hypothetical protein
MEFFVVTLKASDQEPLWRKSLCLVESRSWFEGFQAHVGHKRTSGTRTVDLPTADNGISDTLSCTCLRCQLHELNLMASIMRNGAVINSYTMLSYLHIPGIEPYSDNMCLRPLTQRQINLLYVYVNVLNLGFSARSCLKCWLVLSLSAVSDLSLASNE